MIPFNTRQYTMKHEKYLRTKTEIDFVAEKCKYAHEELYTWYAPKPKPAQQRNPAIIAVMLAALLCDM